MSNEDEAGALDDRFGYRIEDSDDQLDVGRDAWEIRKFLRRPVEEASTVTRLEMMLDKVSDGMQRRLLADHFLHPVNREVDRQQHQHPDLLIGLIPRLGLDKALVDADETTVGEAMEQAFDLARHLSQEVMKLLNESLSRPNKARLRRMYGSVDPVPGEVEACIFMALLNAPPGSVAERDILGWQTAGSEIVFQRALEQMTCRRAMGYVVSAHDVQGRMRSDEQDIWAEVVGQLQWEYRWFSARDASKDKGEPAHFDRAKRVMVETFRLGEDEVDNLQGLLRSVAAWMLGLVKRRQREGRGLPPVLRGVRSATGETIRIKEVPIYAEGTDGASTGALDIDNQVARRLLQSGTGHNPYTADPVDIVVAEITTAAMASSLRRQAAADDVGDDVEQMASLLEFCELTVGPGLGQKWIEAHYPPITTQGGNAFYWSLARAVRPHRVLWRGDGTVDDSRRQWLQPRVDAFRLAMLRFLAEQDTSERDIRRRFGRDQATRASFDETLSEAMFGDVEGGEMA